MKSRVGLAISVGLNLGLVGAFVWLWTNPPSERGARGVGDVVIDFGTNADGSRKEIQLAYPSRPNFKFPTNVLSYITWRSIESPDYRKYIENLRAIRCPEETIEDIIVADINDLYTDRWRQLLQEEAAAFRYWQTGDGLPGFPSREAELLSQNLDRERRDLIEELLGIRVTDTVAEFGAIKPMELTLNFIPEERRAQVIAAQEQFARDQSALLGNLEEVVDLELELTRLRDAYEQQLDGLLTPEERLQFEMTTSSLAMALRVELTGFEPTEEEFRQIYEARKRQEEEIEIAQEVIAIRAAAELEEQRQLEAEHQQQVARQDQLLTQLGPERYADYVRTQDPTYQTLIRSSVLNMVHPVTANKVYELQQIANVEAEKVRANTEFTLDQREAALVGIHAETERTIREKYGVNALRAFQSWQRETAP